MSFREGHLFTKQNQEQYSNFQQKDNSDFQHQHIHIDYPELPKDDLRSLWFKTLQNGRITS